METQVALKNNKSELIDLIKGSLFPSNSLSMVSLYVSYCEGLKLDPILKPAHIAKIRGQDVIMPGIGLYRIMAHRTGVYVGLSEPEFGPILKQKFGHLEIEYPEWCKIKAYKHVMGIVCEFTGFVRWKEACVLKDGSPNDMWAKRTFGQLEKCAEAQALRKAFPESVPQQPTFEEMEGRDFIDGTVEDKEPTKSQNKFKEALSKKLTSKVEEKTLTIDETPPITLKVEEKENYIASNVKEEDKKQNGSQISMYSQMMYMLSELPNKHEVEESIKKRAGIEKLEYMSDEQIEKTIKWISTKLDKVNSGE